MGVDVDEAGRDEFALGGDLFLARAGDFADGGNPATGDRHVGVNRFGTRAIHDGAATDHQIVFGHADSPGLLLAVILRQSAPPGKRDGVGLFA